MNEADFEATLMGLVATHGRMLFRIAHGILRRPELAEDVCQQAFLKAWEQRSRIEEPAALPAWLRRVVVTESLMVARRQRADQRATGRYERPGAASMEQDERAELRGMLEDALAELPEPTQVVVVLRLLEGMTGNEVKTVLGCSASEVSRRLHHGMEHLRRRLSKTYTVTGD